MAEGETGLEDVMQRTLSVTIEIDSDSEFEPLGVTNFGGPIPLRFGIRYKLNHVQFNVPPHLGLNSLTENAADMLAAHLNIRSYASMKNWESVACTYGMSSDSIMMMQRNYNPFQALCNKFPNENLANFVRILRNLKRIDTLYSMKQLLDNNDLYKEEIVEEETEEVVEEEEEEEKPEEKEEEDVEEEKEEEKKEEPQVTEETVLEPSPTLSIRSLPIPVVNQLPNEFILVVHYETNSTERREYRWLMKNLRENQRRTTIIPIIDATEYVMNDNMIESLQDLFVRASHIVVCYSPSFVHLHEIAVSDVMEIKININFIRLMNAEFFRGHGLNFRFRPVFFENLETVEAPFGWTTATIQYKFPSMGQRLLKRLFHFTPMNAVPITT